MVYILLATIAVALVSLSGVFLFGKHERSTHALVSLSIGVFLAVLFFDLIPESIELTPYASWFILLGYLGFFALSYILDSYHHHHDDHCPHEHKKGRGAKLLLIGDAIHNFVDGITIAAGFLVSPAIGFATTVGVLLHEIPQELAEFTILLHGGYTRGAALTRNFITALPVILGGILAYYFLSFFEQYVGILLALAAGNLLYIATSDLLPELREHKEDFWKHLGIILIGILLIALLFAQTKETHTHDTSHSHDEETHIVN